MRQFGTATDYLDLLDQMEQIATSNHIDSATPSAGGATYSVGDILTDASGDGTQTHRASFEVLTEAAGAVTSVKILNGGAYTANPVSPIITSTTGSGTGCTLTVTFDNTGWTNIYDNSPGGERELILQGEGLSGTDEILVGVKTYQTMPGFTLGHNWSCHGFTAFNNLLEFWEQPGISPGLDGSGDPDSSGGAFIPLQNDVGGVFPIDFWFFINENRIIMSAKVEDATTTIYCTMYLGFMNRFATEAESPYPIYIAASTARDDTVFNDTVSGRITGLTEAIGIQSRVGPAFYRKSGNSVWQSVQNSSLADTGSPSRTKTNEYTVYPCGEGNDLAPPDTADRIVTDGSGVVWDDFCPSAGVPGTAADELQPTEDTGGDIFMLVPATVIASNDPDIELVGELDDTFWFSAATGQSSEDTFTDGTGDKYVIFQNGNRTEVFSFLAIRDV